MLRSTLQLLSSRAARPRAVAVAALAVACLAINVCATADAHAAEREPVRRSPAVAAPLQGEARVIVKFKSDSTLMRALSATSAQAEPQHAKTLSSRLGLTLRDGRGLGPSRQLVFGSGISSADLAAKLSAQSDVEYAVVDERKRILAVPNDPRYANGQLTTPVAGQWYLRQPDSTIVSAINAEKAWDITTGSSSIVVAVLDTGIRPEHPDLQGKILPGYDFIHDVGTANDGGARDNDPSDPGDWVTSADVGVVDGCTSSDAGLASSWHGTQTAGLIGALTNNGIGMASVGRNAMLLPLRVLGKCGGYDSDIQDAMRWAVGLSVAGVPANANPAKVLNMSLGSSGACSASYQDVVNQVIATGAVIVVAGGNDGTAVGTPANCSGVLGIAAVRNTGTKVGFSDQGPEIALSAPGGNCINTVGTCLYPLITTTNSGPQGPNTTAGGSIYTDGDNHISVGTSFAAPLVAGTVALMFSVNPALTPAQVKAKLQQSARAFPTTGAGAGVSACTTSTTANAECYCTTSSCGAGMLDANAAVTAAVLSPSIDVSASTVMQGGAVTLDGSGSQAFGGATISNYLWAITSGSNIAGLSSTNAATTTLTTTGTGTVTVTLTITDNAGRQASTSTTITSTAVVAPSSGGGGGGAFDPMWIAGVLVAALALVVPFKRKVAARKAQRR